MAPAWTHPSRWCLAGRSHSDASIQREPVSRRPFQLHTDPMMRCIGPRRQYLRATRQIFDDYVKRAAIEQVSHGQTPADHRVGQRTADRRSGFAKGAIVRIEKDKLRFAIVDTKFRIIHLRVDVAIDENQIEPSGVVEIE